MSQQNINILDLIDQFDKHNMLESISSFPSQIKDSFSITSKYFKEKEENFKRIQKNINSVFICGMGGSAIGGELARIVLLEKARIPIIINRSDIIPNWINDKTLVIISSYSGNTHETISAYNQIKERNAKIIAISSKTGLLNKYCLKYNHIIMNIPSGFQPRCALGYISSMIILSLIKLNLVENYKEIRNELKLASISLKSMNLGLPDDNSAIALADSLKGTIPIIYGRENYSSIIALRFKNQLQENSKMMAFSNNYPEINHNEIEGLNTDNNNFTIVWLKDSFSSDNRKIDKCISAAHGLIDQLGIKQSTLNLNDLYSSRASKSSRLTTLYKSIYFLDWVSYYLALFKSVDPSSINNIEYIKKNI